MAGSLRGWRRVVTGSKPNRDGGEWNVARHHKMPGGDGWERRGSREQLHTEGGRQDRSRENSPWKTEENTRGAGGVAYTEAERRKGSGNDKKLTDCHVPRTRAMHR